MEKRSLGRSKLSVAPLVLGGNVFGWTCDESTSFSILDAFVDAGFNMIDTADVYSAWAPGNRGGESETIIGKWLKKSGKRDRILIATKVAKSQARRGLSPDNIELALSDSLQRLRTDYVDLYQAHQEDARTPQQKTLEAFARLMRQGKIRSIGASNFSAKALQEALVVSGEQGLPRYESLQPEYNLCERTKYESELEPLLLQENIGVICFYALASGFLTGKYRSAADLGKGARSGAVRKYMDSRGLKILSALDAVAAQHHSTPTSVSLAWIMARPGLTAPIASVSRLEQMKALLAAAELNLSAADMGLLDQASAQSAPSLS